MEETALRTDTRYEKMRIDLKTLTTATRRLDWSSAEDHTLARGMKSREKWRVDHSKICKQVFKIKAEANLHELTNLQEKVDVTEKQMRDL